jgi:hypothetical protein
MAEIAANDIGSPSITGSQSVTDPTYGFDINESNYAVVSTDSALWVQIDFGAAYFISRLRFRIGPDSAGTQAQTITVSYDNSHWTTVASWAGQTYYSSLSPFFNVYQPVRYIKYTKAAPNFARLYYLGVSIDTFFIGNRRSRLLLNNPIASPFNFITNFLSLSRMRNRCASHLSSPANFVRRYISIPGEYISVLGSGTATASSTQTTNYPANAVDGNTGTRWNNNAALPSWWKYDLGAGNAECVTKLSIWKYYNQMKTFKVQGSNNDSDWDDIYEDVAPTTTSSWLVWTFANTDEYRYYRLYFPDSNSSSWMSINECVLEKYVGHCYFDR